MKQEFLLEALDSIRQYGSDTLSGRSPDDGPDDREWQRDAVLEMTSRASAAIAAWNRRPVPQAEAWLPIAGVPRDQLPGMLIGWCVGTKEHSEATWRREGPAILTLHNDGPLGFSLKTVQHACWLLDMDTIDEVTMYRRLSAPSSLLSSASPQAEAVSEAIENEQLRASNATLLASLIEMEAYNDVPRAQDDPVWRAIRKRGAAAIRSVPTSVGKAGPPAEAVEAARRLRAFLTGLYGVVDVGEINAAITWLDALFLVEGK